MYEEYEVNKLFSLVVFTWYGLSSRILPI